MSNLLLSLFIATALPSGNFMHNETHQEEQVSAPNYLYKVLSKEDWQASEERRTVQLPAADSAFIHFSKEDQLERIINKYWSNVSDFIVIKVDVSALPGNLKFEANPGGTVRYYHLYDGCIPKYAIVDVQIKSN